MHVEDLKFVVVIATLALGAGSIASAADAAAAQTEPSWHSPSLHSETAVGPNGAVTTRAALLANEKFRVALGG